MSRSCVSFAAHVFARHTGRGSLVAPCAVVYRYFKRVTGNARLPLVNCRLAHPRTLPCASCPPPSPLLPTSFLALPVALDCLALIDMELIALCATKAVVLPLLVWVPPTESACRFGVQERAERARWLSARWRRGA